MTNKVNRTTYSLATAPVHSSKEDLFNKKAHKRRGSDDVDNASLTYSAASSVNSAGESTDSSFADIMRVLDVQDSQELKEFIRKEGVSSVGEFKSRRGLTHQLSASSSLAYSTDCESHLEGTKLLQTIAGQPSDGYGYDGASYSQKDEPIEGDSGLLFAPAEPGRLKTKKKKRDKRQSVSSSDAGSPTAEIKKSNDVQQGNSTPPSKGSYQSYPDASPSPSVDTPTKSPPPERSTPPRHPKQKFHVEDAAEDDEIWYAKWWMFCFADATKNMMPKR